MKKQPDISHKSFTGEIADVRVEKNTGVAWVKVRLDDGSLLGGTFDADDDGVKEVDLSQIDYKILKLSPDSDAAVHTGVDSASLIGGPNSRFVSTRDFGNFIVGPVTITAHPDSVRIGGVYRFNGLLSSTMPSTIITPIPTLVMDMPGKALISSLQTMLNDFSSLLGL